MRDETNSFIFKNDFVSLTESFKEEYKGELNIKQLQEFLRFLDKSNIKINEVIFGRKEKEYFDRIVNSNGEPFTNYIKRIFRREKIKICWRQEKSLVGFR